MLEIDVQYDSSVTNLQTTSPTLYSEFTNGVQAAVQALQSLFSSPITVTIDVGYGEINGQTLQSGALGESETNEVDASYASVRNALIAENAPGSSTLPAASPDQGTLVLSTAQAKALGLEANNNEVDGYVGFSSSLPFSYAAGTTPSSNDYYFVGVVEHEITEVMGRISLLDQQPIAYSLMDLYRYTSSGVRDLSASHHTGSTAYFSIDNGATNLGNWNNVPSNGDLGDWYPSGPAPGGDDAFNDYSYPGVINDISQSDATLMQAIGFAGASTVTVSPTNQTVSPGQSVALSSIFSVSGSGITGYSILLASPADGEVTVNGTPIAANQAVSLSSLSGVDYIGGVNPGADTLSLQVDYDQQTTNWVGATLTDPGVALTATNESANADQSIPLSSIFSVSGSGIVGYHIFLEGPADGEVTVNGTPIAVNQTVNLSSLSGVDYIGSGTAGSDELYLQATDGQQWSNWVGATLSDSGIGVTSANESASPDQSIPLSSIFSVSGSGIVGYHVFLEGPADGEVTVGGTPIAANQTVTLSSLSGVDYIGGINPGADTLYVQATNGQQWSNWIAATLSDTGVTITPTDESAGAGQSIPLSSIFSVSGSGITGYHVFLEGPADGEVTVNGTPIATNQAINLSSLSGVDYIGSGTAGSDMLMLQVTDGQQWSGWVGATLTDTAVLGDLVGIGMGSNPSASGPSSSSFASIYGDATVGFEEMNARSGQQPSNDHLSSGTDATGRSAYFPRTGQEYSNLLPQSHHLIGLLS